MRRRDCLRLSILVSERFSRQEEESNEIPLIEKREKGGQGGYTNAG